VENRDTFNSSSLKYYIPRLKYLVVVLFLQEFLISLCRFEMTSLIASSESPSARVQFRVCSIH
jgi:hypothetical protein